MKKTKILVFAYSLIGHDCLKELIDQGYTIVAVITHADNPAEYHWFPSVATLAHDHQIPVFTPAMPNAPEIIDLIRQLAPDLIFSFYYRQMICQAILDIPKWGAYNMHGSFLPLYRGRCPANWALAHGETELGATLHQMVKSADAGDIVSQEKFLITPTDNALDVIYKTRDVAVSLLQKVVPEMVCGVIPKTPQDLSKGSYFGGRGLKDAVIDWTKPAHKLYNLIRSQLPYPHFPGGVTYWQGHEIRLTGCHLPSLSIERVSKFSKALPGEILSISPHALEVTCDWNSERQTCQSVLVIFDWVLPDSAQNTSFSVGEILG